MLKFFFQVSLQQNHGGPSSDERHVGDLGNILVTAEGVADIFIRDQLVRLSGPDEFSVIVNFGTY